MYHELGFECVKTCFYFETHFRSFLSYLCRPAQTRYGQRAAKQKQIMFPVDLPALQESELVSSAQIYLSSLDGRPHHECYQSSSKPQVKVAITAGNVRQLQLFEDDQPPCAVLALHPPEDQNQVLALYVQDRWWPLDDVLRTSSQSRSGLVQVCSIMERVVVFLLSQVVERPLLGEVSFALHPRTESCKVLWRDNQAVGFYSVKPKGSLCDGWSGCCYLLPVLDTLLVRRSSRRRGLGLQILQDFCASFSSEEFLGVAAPLSASMAAVCRKFLQQQLELRERLYEVEAPGGWSQRRNIWLNIQLGRYSPHSRGEETRPASTDTVD
ncbi:protein FAM169B isoform X1 [Oryzias melastigma]|uniref:protein FAM169B isoform X1 n=1 Tax=Oryzias melastigma TaxID=30732 RepID=UPI00168D274F|nr:protein FAM169B isoform X1 [Oryzias melastigma]XP_036068105.1 protein FAM169B isoform X1 [Oryzias melastigma]